MATAPAPAPPTVTTGPTTTPKPPVPGTQVSGPVTIGGTGVLPGGFPVRQGLGGVTGGSGDQTGTAVTPVGLTGTEGSAKAIIQAALDGFGLSSLGDWAWSKHLNGESDQQIFLEMTSTPEFKTRFPAYDALAKAGNAITPAQYVNYEQTTRALLQQYGVPKGMYDTPDGIAKMLINNVSAGEVNSRLQLAASAAYSAPQEVRDVLSDRYGISPGGLVGFYLDSDKALPLLQQQQVSAQISAAARMQQVGTDYATADTLAARGVTYDQALQGFGQVEASTGLGYGPGETADTKIRTAAAFGDAAAQGQVNRVVKGRIARFGGAGGFAETQSGVVGLGQSSA